MLSKYLSNLTEGYNIWSNCSCKYRIKILKNLRKVITNRSSEISQTIAQEKYRPVSETLAQEVLPTLESLCYFEKHFEHWLKPKTSRYYRPGFMRKKSVIYHEPLGIVGLITPGNFPFSLGMMSLAYLLLAGNTVIMKVSEKTPRVGQLIHDLINGAGLSPNFVQVITGKPAIGEEIIRSELVRKIFFYGSPVNGQRVAKLCQVHNKSYVLEMGGGTTAMVCAGANLDLAASGIVWSACYANGQSCVGTYRVLVEESIADRFIDKMTKKCAELWQLSKNKNKQFGYRSQSSMQNCQLAVKDARENGALLNYGGEIESVMSDYYLFQPCILKVHPDMKIWQNRADGPVLSVYTVKNMESSIHVIQTTTKPLGISIWGQDYGRINNLIKKLDVGMIWVNETSLGLPSLPWGGRGSAGIGSLFSLYALNEVTQLKCVTCHPHFFSRPRIWWYPYSAMKEKMFTFGARWFYK